MNSDWSQKNIGDISPPADLFRPRYRMVFAGERYYGINRIMLMTIGLWPHQKPNILHTVFFFTAYVSFIFFQFTIFLTIKYDFGVIINVLSYIFPTFIYFLFYTCFYFNIKKIKQLLEQIETDWNTVEDSEMRILEKYAIESRLISLILVFLILFGGVVLITIEMLPIILDTVAPMNESRPRKITLDFEMFLDQQQYFYVYLIHEIVVVMVGLGTMVAVGTLLLAFIKHSCATYKITSTLIGNIITKHTLEIPSDQKTYEMYRRVTRVVCMQKKAIQFTRFLLNTMNKWFFVIMVIGVLSLSCNLLRFLTAVIMLKELTDAIICGGVVFGHFMIMFIGNFVGQTIIDHSAEMFTAVCNTAWYLAPLPIQKLLLFMMQYSLKTNTLMVGGLFVASLEGFSTLATTSISYFTVLYSVN